MKEVQGTQMCQLQGWAFASNDAAVQPPVVVTAPDVSVNNCAQEWQNLNCQAATYVVSTCMVTHRN